MNYKIESDFKHQGLRCVVIMAERGYRCGYVGMPKEHILYGIGYAEKTEKLACFNLDKMTVGKRSPINIITARANHNKDTNAMTPDLAFDVHGGITHSGGDGSYPLKGEEWWYGFDCAHYDDAPDIDEMSDEYRRFQIDYGSMDGIIRTQYYVEHECKRLAQQISEMK